MKYAFASRTGNVQSIVETLGLDATQIFTGDEYIGEPYVLLTYTDGFGDIPAEVEAFLSINSGELKGVIGSGDHGYDPEFCGAAVKISETYNVPLIYTVENAGTDEDIEAIRSALAAF